MDDQNRPNQNRGRIQKVMADRWFPLFSSEWISLWSRKTIQSDFKDGDVL
jgi:hypothetical protein